MVLFLMVMVGLEFILIATFWFGFPSIDAEIIVKSTGAVLKTWTGDGTNGIYVWGAKLTKSSS